MCTEETYDNVGLANATSLRVRISSLGSEYIDFIKGEIDSLEFRQSELANMTTVQEYETDMANYGESYLTSLNEVQEYVDLLRRIEAMKQCLEAAKLIIAADSVRKTLGINNSLH